MNFDELCHILDNVYTLYTKNTVLNIDHLKSCGLNDLLYTLGKLLAVLHYNNYANDEIIELFIIFDNKENKDQFIKFINMKFGKNWENENNMATNEKMEIIEQNLSEKDYISKYINCDKPYISFKVLNNVDYIIYLGELSNSVENLEEKLAKLFVNKANTIFEDSILNRKNTKYHFLTDNRNINYCNCYLINNRNNSVYFRVDISKELLSICSKIIVNSINKHDD